MALQLTCSSLHRVLVPVRTTFVSEDFDHIFGIHLDLGRIMVRVTNGWLGGVVVRASDS